MKRTLLLISAVLFSVMVWGQKVTLYLSGNQTYEYDISQVDSMVFSDTPTVEPEEIVVTVDANGNADGGHLFERIDESSFLIDNIKYTFQNAYLVVSGYDKVFFNGVATIISKLIYKGMTMDVVGIGSEAFSGCTNLTSINIPNSVTSIDNFAFSGCSGLTSIIVESGNTVYDSRNNCNAIIETAANRLRFGCQNTIIPNSVTSIGDAAFFGCAGLTSITIPNSVTSIGVSAFNGCSSLQKVIVPDIAAWCEIGFENNTANPLYYAHRLYSDEVTEIKNLIIPNSVTSIGSYAFSGCSSLTSITIPNSVTSIGSSAFYGCSGLTSITIPEGVTSIGYAAFKECDSLTDVTLESNAIVSASRNSNASMKSIFGEHVKEYVIGDNVTSIGSYAFSGCSGLTSVIIGNGVTSIGNSAFSGCSGLTSVIIGNGVTSIGNYAFSGCSGLTSITIPNSVTSIGHSAFSGCSSLTSVTIGSGVTSIGDYVFSGCSGLTSIIVESGNTVYDSRNNCNAIIETATNTLIAGCQNTIIPNNVTSIDNFAFSGCSGLTSVTIGSGVKSIGEYAFSGCSSLTDVYCLAENVPNTSSSAFYDSSITSATLHVPAGSVEAYKAKDPWKRFKSIVAIE